MAHTYNASIWKAEEEESQVSPEQLSKTLAQNTKYKGPGMQFSAKTLGSIPVPHHHHRHHHHHHHDCDRGLSQA